MGPNYFRMASELASELRGDRRPWQASSELMVREAAWHMANKLRAGELPATSQVNELRAGEELVNTSRMQIVQPKLVHIVRFWLE